ncbi:MAG: hypothetical protein LBQ83_04850, partial [Candidatus Margulisbacteria bacterium]|nr:hypothetical protein [Candidatus Margulisiibacteriota bacterium]
QKYDTGTVERLPQIYTLGLGWRVLEALSLYYDRRQPADSSTAQDYAGLEIFLTPHICLAAGGQSDRFTAGAGLVLEHVYFDYAYAAQTENNLGSDQYISLGVRW